MNSIPKNTALVSAAPGRLPIAVFGVSVIAAVLSLVLLEGGVWAWVLLAGMVAAGFVGPLFLHNPWRAVYVVVLPAICMGELWTFSVGTGTRITPAFVVVCTCVFLSGISLLRSKQVRLRQIPLVVPFTVYIMAVALSFIPSVSKLHWARGLSEAIIGLGCFVFGYVYLQNRTQLHSFLKLFLALTVATVLFGLLQHWLYDYVHTALPLLYDDVDVTWVEQWYKAGRIVANWAHPSSLGSIINLAAPIALYYYLESETLELWYIFTYLLLAFGVLMTSTRTPIVAFFISSSVLIFLLRRRIARLALPLAGFILVVVAAPLLFSPLQRFDLNSRENEITVETRSVSRLEALLMFIHNPVLGVGTRNYGDRVKFTVVGTLGEVHNVFIQEAAETGIVGLTCFIALLYIALRSDFRWKRTEPRELRELSWTLFAACFAIIIECLAENSLYVWQVWCLFWLFRGISVALRTRPEAFAERLLRPELRMT